MSQEATKAGPIRLEDKGVCVGLMTIFIKKRPVIKASTTTNQNIHLGKEGSPSRRLMIQCSESRKEASRLTPLLTPRTTARVATWNIRTMYETGETIQVAREMKNYKIGVLGLSETRWLQSEQLRLSSWEQLLYWGHIEDGAPHTERVALILPPEAHGALIGWEPVNSRIITAKFTTKKKDIRLNIIQCYAPTNDAEKEKKDDFYQQLQAVWQKRSKGHNHTDGGFQRQDRNGQHGLRGHHGDTWTGTDKWKWWAFCRPLRPEPGGDRRQHLPTQAHP